MCQMQLIYTYLIADYKDTFRGSRIICDIFCGSSLCPVSNWPINFFATLAVRKNFTLILSHCLEMQRNAKNSMVHPILGIYSLIIIKVFQANAKF